MSTHLFATPTCCYQVLEFCSQTPCHREAYRTAESRFVGLSLGCSNKTKVLHARYAFPAPYNISVSSAGYSTYQAAFSTQPAFSLASSISIFLTYFLHQHSCEEPPRQINTLSSHQQVYRTSTWQRSSAPSRVELVWCRCPCSSWKAPKS